MIKRRSKKRAAQNRKYLKLRAKFLEENELCQAGLEGCTIMATTIHHRRGRIQDRLTDVKDFLGCCFSCHELIEHSPEMAKEKGFSKSRLTVDS